MGILLLIPIGVIPREIVMNHPSKQSCPSNTQSQEKRVILPHMSCNWYADVGFVDDLVTGRPATTVTNPRYSYAQPSRRTSSYSYAGGVQTSGPSGKEPRQENYAREYT